MDNICCSLFYLSLSLSLSLSLCVCVCVCVCVVTVIIALPAVYCTYAASRIMSTVYERTFSEGLGYDLYGWYVGESKHQERFVMCHTKYITHILHFTVVQKGDVPQ